MAPSAVRISTHEPWSSLVDALVHGVVTRPFSDRYCSDRQDQPDQLQSAGSTADTADLVLRRLAAWYTPMATAPQALADLLCS
jgi:hypothetical protein